MSRVADLRPDQLSAEQNRIYEEIAAPRAGVVRGPFAVWLRTPKIADAANRLGNSVRVEGKIDRRLLELAVLIVARHWNAEYVWFVHEKEGLEAGLSKDVIDAVSRNWEPKFSRSDEKVVYDIVTELHQTRTVGPISYKRAVAALGLEPFIELITAIGFYTTAAMMINAFDVPVPEGARPLLSHGR